jgi:hypothetical protein
MKKKAPEIEAIVINDEGKQITIPWDDVSIHASSSPCDLCGEHGEVEIDLPNYPTITAYSW